MVEQRVSPCYRGGPAAASNQLSRTIDASTPLEANDFRMNVPRFSPENRAANLGAVDVTLLDADLRTIDEAFAAMTVHGARYSAALPAMIDRC